MAEADIRTLRLLYACFNARDIDGVLVVLADDVAWANGMDGGHVHGHEALRDYWTRQWAMVSPHVEPFAFAETANETVAVEVIQTVRDLHGKPLHGQTHGLEDKTVTHVFHLANGKIIRFDIGEPTETHADA